MSGCLILLTTASCSQHSPAAVTATKPAKINVDRISHITPGMTLVDVIREEGPPTDMKNNVYFYRQRGRVVFEGTASPTDKTKVLRVDDDPAEDGYP